MRFLCLHRRLLNSSTLGRRLCQYLRIALDVYNCSLCQHHCTAVSPSFSCFSPAQFTKNSPVGRCQTQLRTLPLISPRHCNSVVPSTMVILLIMHISYYIDDFLVFSFFLSNWILMCYMRFIIRSSQTPRSSSWRCRCCSQLAPSHYQKIMTRHMTLDDQLNSTLQFTYLI